MDSEFESELTRLPAYKIIEAIRAKKVGLPTGPLACSHCRVNKP